MTSEGWTVERSHIFVRYELRYWCRDLYILGVRVQYVPRGTTLVGERFGTRLFVFRVFGPHSFHNPKKLRNLTAGVSCLSLVSWSLRSL